MKTTIKNEFLTVEINHKGAEIAAIFKGNKNYIWEIDERFWDKTSPVLFPIIGGLKNDSYEFEGKTYQFPRHGFAREMDFELINKTEDSAVFSLQSSNDTLGVFPFNFTLNIEYYLVSKQLFVKYIVKNTSNEKMYFSIGAHPAFSLSESIENYALEFDQNENLISHLLENHVFSGETISIPLDHRILKLNDNLFARDAIVLKNSTTSSLTLLKNNIPQLKVNFSDFPYLGIWRKKDAPFICIEPWLGIADNHNTSGKIQEKEGIQELAGNAEVSYVWSVEFFD